MPTEVFLNSPTAGIVAPIATLSGNGGSVSASATSWLIAAALPTAAQAAGGQFHALIGVVGSPMEEVVIPCQSGTTLTGITRGAEGSTAASHADGVGIYPILTPGALGNALSGGAQITVTEAGNLGAAYALDLQSKQNSRVLLTGTLNANCVVTVSNRAAGCEVVLMLLQDATGGRTCNISDGTASQQVIAGGDPGTTSVLQVDCPDATDMYVSALGGPGGGATTATVQAMIAAALTGHGVTFVIRESGGVYPARATGAPYAGAADTVIWVGVDAPTIGSGYAINDVDIWDPTSV